MTGHWLSSVSDSVLTFGLRAFVLTLLIAGCERRGEPDAMRRDGHQSEPGRPDSALAHAPIAAKDSTVQASRTDSGVLATPVELSKLSATLDVPVQGVTLAQLRDTYSERRGGRMHEAMDILAARGTPVLSATGGRLLKLFNSKAGGLMVYATDESEHFILLYGHLDRYAVGLSDGMRLERGQVIGYVGTTGNAPAGTPHLHFGVLRGQPKVSWSKGVAVNPYPLLVHAKPLTPTAH